MDNKLKQFKIKAHNATDAALVDSLIDHAKKMVDDTDYYEAVKIAKTEILSRLRG